jgi:hypothetical protein
MFFKCAEPMTPYLAALTRRRCPSSIVAPNLRTTIPLNRNGDVNQQPLRRPGGSSRSLCSAQPRPMRLGLPAHAR